MEKQSKLTMLAKGSTMRIIALLVNMGVFFFIFPFIVGSLGDEMFGLWAIISSLTGYYFLLDFGISHAINVYVSRLIGAKKHKDISEVMTNSVSLFSVLSIVALVVTAAVIVAFPFVALHIAADFSSEQMIRLVQILLVIVGIEMAFSLPFRAYQGVLRAHLRFDWLAIFEITRTLLRSALFIVVLVLDYGIIALALVNLVANVLWYGSSYVYARLNYSYLKINFAELSWKKIKEVFGFGFFIFVTNITDIFRFRLDAFVIAGFIGLSAVTIYSIATKIIDMFMDLMWRVVGVLEPIYGRYAGTSNMEQLRTKYLLGIRFAFVVGSYISGCIFVFGNFFITNWMGPGYEQSYVVLSILVIPFAIFLSQAPSGAVMRSLGKHRYFTIIDICDAVANLTITLILVKNYGLIGVAIGTVVPLVFFAGVVKPIVVSRILKITATSYIVNMISLKVFFVLFFGMIFYFIHHVLALTSVSFIAMAGWGIVIALLYGGLLYITLLHKQEKVYTHKVIDKIKSKVPWI